MVNVNWLSNTKITVHHVMKSMAYRKKNTVAMLAVLSFGFYLFFLFQNIKGQLIENINQYSLKQDLIISMETAHLPLVLFSLFQIGSSPPSISQSQLDELINHPEIEYAIPYAYGETHRGITVIGTSPEGIEKLIQQHDNEPERENKLNDQSEIVSLRDNPMTAYIGANIAKHLDYKINDKITIADGNEPILEQEYPELFTIAGILPRLNTHQDDGIFVPLDGLITARQRYAGRHATSWLSPDDISYIDIKLKDRMALLAMEQTLTQSAAQRGLNITAAMPAKELGTLYSYLNKAAMSLISMSMVTLGLCLITLFYALTSNIQERKQEILLYRTLGMSQSYINIMAVLEPLLIIAAALLLGFVSSDLSSIHASEFFMVKWLMN